MSAIEAVGEAIGHDSGCSSIEFVVPTRPDLCDCGVMDDARAAVAALAAQGDITDEQIVEALKARMLDQGTERNMDRLVAEEISDVMASWGVLPVRALLARQAAVHATREAEWQELNRRADEELNGCYDRIEALKNERDELDGENRGLREHIDTMLTPRAGAAEAEVTALREEVAGLNYELGNLRRITQEYLDERRAAEATVERMEALLPTATALASGVASISPEVTRGFAQDVCAALADPNPDQHKTIGAHVEDGGVWGTVVRCHECNGQGVLHRPDEYPQATAPLGLKGEGA